jgi:ferredoxin
MRKNIGKIILFKAFPAIFLLCLLSACTKSGQTGSTPGAAGDGQNDDQSANENIRQQSLTVNEFRCSGCGRCAQMDPEHFSFNRSTRKAVVVSSENLDSRDLALAISICRDRAIDLS